MMLLDKLKERTSYCPYCSGETSHIEQPSGECPLEYYWFNDEPQDESDWINDKPQDEDDWFCK